MSYENPPVPHEVNVSRESPLAQFLRLCAGIGLCMALFCDFRYMAEGQKLTTAFAKRGLIAEHGASWMLPRLVGVTNALDLLLSARTLVTAEAAQIGRGVDGGKQSRHIGRI